MALDPPDLPLIVSAGEARDAGLSKDQIRQRLRSGAWLRLARGQYSRAAASDDPCRLHVQRAVANARNNPLAVIGYESAVLMHGLPLSRPAPESVSLCVPAGLWTGHRSGVHFRALDAAASQGRLMVAPFAGVAPVPVVSPAAAWVHVASMGSLADALVVGDAALRRRLLTRADLSTAFDLMGPRRGRRTILSALHHIDGRRESPLESQSWCYFLRHRIPLPEVQVEIFNEWGQFVARVDVLWRNEGIVGEIDGRSKYQTGSDLYREKRREDEARDLGLGFIRWGAFDLRTAALAMRIKRSLDQARSGRTSEFRGSMGPVRLAG